VYTGYCSDEAFFVRISLRVVVTFDCCRGKVEADSFFTWFQRDILVIFTPSRTGIVAIELLRIMMTFGSFARAAPGEPFPFAMDTFLYAILKKC
jgi:hypothetical protein